MGDAGLPKPESVRGAVRRGPIAAAVGLALAVAGASAAVALILRTPPAVAPPRAPELPAPRFGAAMAYDPSSHDVVLFSGDGGESALDDTWSWNGARWSRLHPASSPPALVHAMLAYDPASGGLVLTGGATLEGGAILRAQGRAWTWNGATWRLAASAGLPPGAAGGTGSALATDEGTGQLILVTGAGSCAGFQTWRWDRGRWLLLHPATSPPPGTLDQLAFDPLTESLLLFSMSAACPGAASPAGGDGVWSWDGTAWRERDRSDQASPPGPGQPAESAMGLLLQTPSGTFLWSGSGWTEVAVAGTEVVEPAIAYDAARREVVLYGGICMSCGTVAPLDETWTWDGSWRPRAGTPAPPSPRPPS